MPIRAPRSVGVPRTSPRPSKFHLLVEPRETLPVLEFISNHPNIAPKRASKELGIGINTWYEAVERLARMRLVTGAKALQDTRTRTLFLTPKGVQFLQRLNEALALSGDTPALLEFELENAAPRKGSARAGEVICHLLMDAERRGDFEEMSRLERAAANLGRPAERWLAVQVAAFLHGEMEESRRAAEKALSMLGRDENTPTRRKVLFVYAATLEYLGDEKAAYTNYTSVRILARAAKDVALESDAWLGIGIRKTRSGQIHDGIKFLERALERAKASGIEGKRAKVLANLAFAELVAGRETALEHADEALEVARRVGAQIVVARAQLNRALLLAAAGSKQDSLRALGEARRLLRSGGEERGSGAVEEWAGLVRRILRHRRSPCPEDWRDQALLLARQRPSRSPAKRRAKR